MVKCANDKVEVLTAAKNGDLESMKTVLSRNSSQHITSKKDKDGKEALHIAAANGDEQMVTILLRHGAKIDATDHSGRTPLHLAAENGHLNIGRALIAGGAKVDKRTPMGQQAIHLACRGAHVDILRCLVEEGGADVNKHGKILTRPLHYACGHKDPTCAKILLDSGADPNVTDAKGYTPLHVACKDGHTKTVTELLRCRADVNVKNGRRLRTPLHKAAQYKHTEIVNLLCEYGAAIDEQDTLMKTALHYAVENNDLPTLQVLLSRGANTSLINHLGKTPTQIALKQGRLDDVKLLNNPTSLDSKIMTGENNPAQNYTHPSSEIHTHMHTETALHSSSKSSDQNTYPPVPSPYSGSRTDTTAEVSKASGLDSSGMDTGTLKAQYIPPHAPPAYEDSIPLTDAQHQPILDPPHSTISHTHNVGTSAMKDSTPSAPPLIHSSSSQSNARELTDDSRGYGSNPQQGAAAFDRQEETLSKAMEASRIGVGSTSEIAKDGPTKETQDIARAVRFCGECGHPNNRLLFCIQCGYKF